MPPPHDRPTGIAGPLPPPPSLGPRVVLNGHVMFIEGYALPHFVGCHAGFVLDDTGKTVAVLTSDQRMQGLLETALATGFAVQLTAQQYTKNPPDPWGSGPQWGTTEVYNPVTLILWNFKDFKHPDA